VRISRGTSVAGVELVSSHVIVELPLLSETSGAAIDLADKLRCNR
jgi:hypothetical protein